MSKPIKIFHLSPSLGFLIGGWIVLRFSKKVGKIEKLNFPSGQKMIKPLNVKADIALMQH